MSVNIFIYQQFDFKSIFLGNELIDCHILHSGKSLTHMPLLQMD